MNTEIPHPQELNAQERSSNFDEVLLGYTEEQALKEANRCLQCNANPCSVGCPVGINIKAFIKEIQNKEYGAAYRIIREKNNFPSICGRVCPAEYQCRKACVYTKKGEPFASEKAINIHLLERFAGDYGITQGNRTSIAREDTHANKKVAVVGSGPAGICVAGELARHGVRVDIYEALHKAGGVLQYGIPPFRLPRNILSHEIDSIKAFGVTMHTNVIVGKSVTIPDLFNEEYDAIFLGLGAGVPFFLGVPGENLCNVYSANEYLTRVNLMNAFKFPTFHTPINNGKHIVIIGGGNTAMDAARVAIRLQKMNDIAPNTTIVYRRTEREMPARRPEIEHAKEEGVQFRFLVQPKGFTGDENGYVQKMLNLQCELGEPDASGRRRPVPLKGSDFELNCDVAIVALGLKANAVLTSVTPEINVDKWGDIIVNTETMETSVKNVFAGGDIVGGEGTVIEAMRMGKSAASAILNRFK